jgi:hypothetical protein
VSGIAAACGVVVLWVLAPPNAVPLVRGFQDPSEAKSSPAYTKAEFQADREVVLAAIRESSARVAEHDFSEAIGTLDEALAEIRPASLQATLWSSRADVHHVQGELSQAWQDLEAAEGLLASLDEATRQKEGCAPLACYLCSQRGKLYFEWGLVDLAHVWVSRAKALLPVRTDSEVGTQPEPFDRERIMADYVEVLVLDSMEDWSALEASVTEALQDEVYTRFPSHKPRLLARLGLGLKVAARTNPAETDRARAVLEAALADPKLSALDRILPELGLAELDLRASDWTAAERRIASAADAMGPEAGRVDLPLYTAWLASSARLLVERTDVAASPEALAAMRAELEGALERRVEEWARRDLRPGGYGPLHQGDQQSLVSELLRLDLALQPGSAGVETALEHLLSAGATGTLARKLAAPAVSPTDLRTQLVGRAEDHALLFYFPAPNRTHLFVVETGTTEHFLLAAGDFVELARSRAEASLQRPLADGAPAWHAREREAALARLTDVLLPKEVVDRLKGTTRWTIVGEDLLGAVPFEALSPYGAYLGTTHAITHLPSPAIGVRLAARACLPLHSAKDAADGAVLLLSAPLGSERDLTASEASEVIAAYPSACRRIVSGRGGTLAALQEGLSSASVAQVFAHGRYDERRERPAGMLLASAEGEEETFVGADELETLDAPPLAVLTVCGAARAPKRRGDAAAADLAGALLSAGDRARCVVQSSYDLDVESARQLSLRFHGVLALGESPAEALRAARASLARDPRFADPFHHALVVAVGLGHEPVFAR